MERAGNVRPGGCSPNHELLWGCPGGGPAVSFPNNGCCSPEGTNHGVPATLVAMVMKPETPTVFARCLGRPLCTSLDSMFGPLDAKWPQ